MAQVIKICFSCGSRIDDQEDQYGDLCRICFDKKLIEEAWNQLSDKERQVWSDNKEEILSWVEEDED